LLVGNKIQALKQSTVVNPINANTDPQNNPPSNEYWTAIVGMYGVLRPGISQMRFASLWGDDSEIIGTIAFDPTDDRFLLFDVDADTLPQNTLSPVNAVIDPLISGPGTGLPSATLGQRYLILNSVGNYDNQYPAAAWGDLVANTNDIIEFDGVQWVVAFANKEHYNDVQFVTNITTGLQYRWTGETWVKSYEGLYPGGDWSLVL
jgi:hypothetical protein